MKIKDLRPKNTEELERDFTTFKKELFSLRFQKVQGEAIKTHRVRQLKKAVARVSTLLNEMKLGINVTRNTQKKTKEKQSTAAKKVASKEKKLPKTTKDKLNKNKKDA
ncbi:MAG: 50S ribosomal protein L29 [Rickettsiales bacterium]|nr:50S ribosomal protein L29 [Rickettsiales bacterium]